MTTYEFEHSVETSASPAAVWAVWSDVTRWTAWDTGVESVVLDGPFAVGTSGTMVIPGQPPIAFTLIEVLPHVGFTDETEVPGARLRFRHVVTPVADGRLKITHSVVIDGPAARELGPMVASDLPEAVEALAKLAEA